MQVDHVELEFKSAAANYTSIDMLVRHKGAALALEVDGPWHFTANTPYRCVRRDCGHAEPTSLLLTRWPSQQQTASMHPHTPQAPWRNAAA